MFRREYAVFRKTDPPHARPIEGRAQGSEELALRYLNEYRFGAEWLEVRSRIVGDWESE